MAGVEREGDAATCGDPNTGSTTVRANGRGVTRVNVDAALGLIIGPGSQTVFVEGYNVSLPGDSILPHPCCGSPGCGAHCAATTTSESTNVFAGEGFPTETITTNNQGGATEDIVVTTAADVLISTFTLTPASMITFVTTGGIDTELTEPGAVTVGAYTIRNIGNTETGPFTVGLFEIPKEAGEGIYYLTELQALEGVPGAVKVDEQTIEIGPYSSYSGEFTIDVELRAPDTYYFAIFADTYIDLVEPNQDNTFPAQTFTVT
jgi:hypothetical protein